jgi:hypothetical protein
VRVEFTVVADDAGEEAAGAPKDESDTEGTDLSEEGALGDFEGSVGGCQSFTSLSEKDLTLGVRRVRLELRLRSWPPTSRSRSAICSLMADCDTRRRRPASLKVPCSATAQR